MTIRILADREPYASFADMSTPTGTCPAQGPLTGSFVLLSGPAALDEAAPDIVVMPAPDFLALSPDSRGKSVYVVYGTVGLMARAFECGCAEYIREPWSLPELYARLARLINLEFQVGETTVRLSGSVLKGSKASVELKPGELALFRLLVRNAHLLVTRKAALASLSLAPGDDSHALGHCAVSLRHCLESVEPGWGRCLHAVRGLGYRIDIELCG